MSFSPTDSVLQLPKHPGKSQGRGKAGAVLLHWLFLAVCGLGLGIVLVLLSVLTALM